MQATIDWQGNACFAGTTDSGHRLMMDGPGDRGGVNAGARPMEMLLLGLGGCTAFDVVDILRRGRCDVTDCRASIDAQRDEGIPAVFTRIHIHFDVTGRGLQPAKVARAVEMTATKYCSASIMLERGGVEISHDFTIVEAASEEDAASNQSHESMSRSAP